MGLPYFRRPMPSGAVARHVVRSTRPVSPLASWSTSSPVGFVVFPSTATRRSTCWRLNGPLQAVRVPPQPIAIDSRFPRKETTGKSVRISHNARDCLVVLPGRQNHRQPSTPRRQSHSLHTAELHIAGKHVRQVGPPFGTSQPAFFLAISRKTRRYDPDSVEFSLCIKLHRASVP